MTAAIAFGLMLIAGGAAIWAGCFWLRDHPTVTKAGLWWFSLGGTALILFGIAFVNR